MFHGHRIESDRGDWRRLFIALVAVGLVLTAGVIPGVFIVDENNYLVTVLALRRGRVTVPNTEGLTPSRELLFFDPGPQSRVVNRTPVAATAPPLYALMALPFSWLGWRGLAGLNTFAYLVTVAIVFAYTRRYATQRASAWLAASAFAFCGFSLEYAMGMWPQSLSVALCTGAIFLIGKVIETGDPARSAVAGLLLGIATGVRYQNAALLAVVAASIVLWSNRRIRCIVALGLSSSVPIAAISMINFVRLNSWNPISKGSTYLRVPLVQDPNSSWLDPLIMLWARVVDFSYRPHVAAFDGWDSYDPLTGAHLVFGFALRKALLQSAPWAAVGLVAMCVAWIGKSHSNGAIRRQTRFLSLVVFSMFAVFAMSGISRDEGLSFNQRYFLELVPLVAVVFAWSLDEVRLPLRVMGVGVLSGAVLVLLIRPDMATAAVSQTSTWPVRLYALLKVPLILAAGLLGLWGIARVRGIALRPLALAVGVCLGWAMALHLATDVVYAQGLRRYLLEQTKMLDRFIPDHSALVAYRGMKEPAGPLLLDRDLVVIDPNYDRGADTPTLVAELLAQNRRVFVLTDAMPADILHRITNNVDGLPVGGSKGSLIELTNKSANP